MLEVTALGFVSVTTIVHLAPERRAVADIVLSRRPTELARVTVIAEYSRNLAEFERHRTRGVGGHFLTAEEIARQPGTSVGGLVRGLPGVIVRYIPREGYQVKMRRAATAFMSGIEECTPTLYIDGRRSVLGMEFVEGMIRSEEIAGIEVYARASERPMEFREMFDTCGAIALWTKPYQSRTARKR
jgi:hypothetical protein